MKTHLMFLLLFVASCLFSHEPAGGAEGDWPRWRGPHRDGISRETGLLKTWPDGGPTELWRIPLGLGYSAVTVVNGRAYTMYATETSEMVVSVSVADGKVLWRAQSGGIFKNEYGNGPRSTPTVVDGHVYTHGASGSLLCLNAESGEKVWGFNTLEKFNAENLDFGLSASPVIVGDMLLVVVGGKDGKSLVALNKSDGKVIWTSLSDKGGYSTPLPIEADGLRQLAVLTGQAIVGVALDDGRELWRYPWKTTLDANVATPIFHEGRLFVSSGYGTGCALFELTVNGEKCSINHLWASKKMKNYFSTSILLDGHLYGFNGTRLTCMDFENGDVHWSKTGFNRGSVAVVEDLLIILGERATLALAKASPEGYEEIARVPDIIEAKTWTVPTIANGRMFLRNEKELVCLDIRQ